MASLKALTFSSVAVRLQTDKMSSLVTDTDDDATSFETVSRVFRVQLASDQGETQMFPESIDQSLLQSNDPFPTGSVNGVLPHRFDPVTEQVNVAVDG